MTINRVTPLWSALTLTTACLAAPMISQAASPAPGGSTRIATRPATTSTMHPAGAARTAGPVAAVVNGEPITTAEWMDRLRLMAGKNALDNLVHEKILRQEARKNGVSVTPAEIEAKAKEFENGYRQRLGTPARFSDFLKQQGLSAESFHAAIRYSAEMQTLRQKLAEKLGAKVTVSDKELQDLYEKQKFQFVQPAEVKMAHIMLNFTGLDDTSQNKTKADATALLVKVKAPGADFVALAKQYSQDADTKEKGGELPWMSFSPWGPPFDQVVMAAPVGLIDQPVRSYKGYHIVKVLDKHPQRTRTFDEVKADLRKRILDQRQAQEYSQYMQKAEASAKTEVKLKF